MPRVFTCILLSSMTLVGCNPSNPPAPNQSQNDAGVGKPDASAALKPEPSKQPSTATQPFVNSERKAAEWVVESGGTVRVTANGIVSEHPKDGNLPAGEFQVVEINLHEASKKGKLTNEGVAHIGGLKHLTVLILDSPGVTDFRFLDGMESMDYLHLNETGITDADLVHLKRLTKLQTLNIEHFFGNPKITDAGVENLKGLKGLVYLSLWGANITDVSLNHVSALTKLKGLRLGKSPITDAGVMQLTALTDLTSLHLAGTQITDAAFETIKGFANLELLNVEGTGVTDGGVKAFEVMHPKCKVHRPENK